MKNIRIGFFLTAWIAFLITLLVHIQAAIGLHLVSFTQSLFVFIALPVVWPYTIWIMHKRKAASGTNPVPQKLWQKINVFQCIPYGWSPKWLKIIFTLTLIYFFTSPLFISYRLRGDHEFQKIQNGKYVLEDIHTGKVVKELTKVEYLDHVNKEIKSVTWIAIFFYIQSCVFIYPYEQENKLFL